MKYIFYLIPLLVSLHLISIYNPPRIKYYEFALKKCNITSDWSIHGLWPQYDHNHWPQFCRPHFHFNDTQLKFELPVLTRDWTSCYGKSTNYHFWKHEYLKHGTCSPYNETEYFRIGLNLFQYVTQTPWIIPQYCPPHNLTDPLQCLIPFNLNLTLRNP